MLPFRSNSESRPTFEELFFEHHGRLFEWALQMTERDRPEAEDLVQELYIRFARAGAPAEHIENAKDYLFSVLRNLHFARKRRGRVSAIDDLSVVDYETVERGLRSVDRSAVLFIREDLKRVCTYLCERKSSSRAACHFLLRYFLGYFPNEVMKIAKATRIGVDKAIQAARREARLDLERPGFLRPMGSKQQKKLRGSSTSDDPQNLFLALRDQIFASCTGECFALSALEEKYAQADASFTTDELGHLVSCPVCLDHANRYLGLPLLADRSPDGTIDRDTPRGPGNPGAGTPTLVTRRAGKQKDVDIEQRKRRMERSIEEAYQHRPQRLLIAVNGDIRASQKVAAVSNELHVELRRKEKLQFVEVLSEQSICLAFLLIEPLDPEASLQQVREIALSDDRSIRVAVSFAAEAPAILVSYSDPLIAEEGSGEQKEAIPPIAVPPSREITELGKIARFLEKARSLKMNPLLAGGLLFALCSIVCFVLWTRSGPHITPQSLLNRAAQSDASVTQFRRPEVIYQRVRISGRGHAMERAIYRDAEGKRRLKPQRLNPDDQQLQDQLNLAGVSWDVPLSASNYQHWRDRQPRKKEIVTESGRNLLTLTTATEESSPVLKESLTVRESDFHPVGHTIELRDAGTVEIAELNFDVMPWGAVNQDLFEPLSGTATDAPGILPAIVHVPHVLSDLELDEAELEVRIALNQLQADTGEPIHVARAKMGIEVKGVVDTEARKDQLVSRLSQLPHVQSSILSVEELGSRPPSVPSSGQTEPIHVYSVEAQASPLEQYLRERRQPLDLLASISQKLLDGSLKIQQANAHLSELQPRFANANQLPDDLQNQLTALSQRYLDAIEAGLETNQRELVSLGFVDGNPSPGLDPDSNVGDLDAEIGHYQDLCRELITNPTNQPHSAAVIANELLASGDRIRRCLTQRAATLPWVHN